MYGLGDQFQYDAATIKDLKKEIKELKRILELVQKEVQLSPALSMLVKRAIK